MTTLGDPLPHAQATLPAPVPTPPVLVREQGVVAGVAAGTALHLGVRVAWVRWAFALTTAFGGAGALAYVLLWVMTPRSGAERPAVGLTRPTGAGVLLVTGVVVLVTATASMAGGLFAGWTISVAHVIPLFAVGAGALLAWSQLEATDRRAGAVRIGLGALLAVAGSIVLVVRDQGVALAWDVLLATIAVLGGLALVLAPLGMRFWHRYQAEQTSRIRETERADIAAHLHDSVLQTLALIQRTDDPARITRLARAQERELRAWLYGAPTTTADTLAAAISAEAHEIEDLHGVPVDLVVTGDRPLDDDGRALTAATREALANAVRHGAPPVSAYVEIGPRLVEVFVRDHGPGFDVDAVPEDRLGVRESLFGRMERHGGTARVRRLEEGTEVGLTLPVDPPEERGDGTDTRPSTGSTVAPESSGGR